jgi:hypothetical protein
MSGGGGGCDDGDQHENDISDLTCFAHCAAMAFLPEFSRVAVLPTLEVARQGPLGGLVDHIAPPDPYPPRTMS